MLRKASVLLGLAVLLSLLFPVKALLAQASVDPVALRLAGVDLAGLCALAGLLPAMALCRDARVAERIPRWNAWLALLALSSIAFVLLHVTWSLDLATALLRDAVAGQAGVSHLALVDASEFAVRVGVLVSTVGVLLNLHAAPDPDAVRPARRRKA